MITDQMLLDLPYEIQREIRLLADKKAKPLDVTIEELIRIGLRRTSKRKLLDVDLIEYLRKKESVAHMEVLRHFQHKANAEEINKVLLTLKLNGTIERVITPSRTRFGTIWQWRGKECNPSTPPIYPPPLSIPSPSSHTQIGEKKVRKEKRNSPLVMAEVERKAAMADQEEERMWERSMKVFGVSKGGDPSIPLPLITPEEEDLNDGSIPPPLEEIHKPHTSIRESLLSKEGGIK